MSIKKKYRIDRIDYHTAMDIVVKNHYLHRKCPCSFAFALIEKTSDKMDLFNNGRIAGVIVYGTPSSAPLRSGICGKDESNNVLELSRLWIEDSAPKNSESYLIGNTIKLVDKEVIVSYADASKGHIGTVYQATNWIYTGLSAKRTEWSIDGIDKHCQTLSDKYNSSEIRLKYGDRFNIVDRARKHRYVFFNATKRRKKELLRKLNYEVKPYPQNAK